MRPSSLVLTAFIAMLAVSTASAQAPRPVPPPGGAPQGQRPPQPPPIAPAKPYKVIPVTLPTPVNDPSLEAFRKQLAEVAKRKDRAGLAKLVVARGFFWETENGDKAAKNKSGIDNLSAALRLGARGSFGWEMLGAHAADQTAMPYPNRNDVICAPADVTFDDKEFEQVVNDTQTDFGEWGHTVADGVEVRASAQPDSPVVEKIGLHLVRVIPEPGPPPQNQNEPPPLKIVTPSGKTGFIPADALAPLGNEQLCYVKDAGGWKITGYVGDTGP